MSVDRSGRQRSPEEQHADNERAAQAYGWTLGEAYRDVGSASRYAAKAREGFDRLIADLEADRFAGRVLILWEASRGSRKVSEWVTLLELLERRHVKVFVTSDHRLYDPADARDRRSLIDDANDSEYESSKISKRAKRAQAANAAAGRPSGVTPYGYRRVYDDKTGRLVEQVPEPVEAEVVRELFARLHKGHSLRSVAADFEARGIRSRAGRVFSARQLREMALRDAYAGVRVHDPSGTGKGRPGPAAERRKATWPAIVEPATFQAVRRRLTAPERVTTRPGRGVHLLSLIAACDPCGGLLTARTGKAGRAIYVCRDGGHVRIGQDDLDDYAAGMLLAYLSNPDVIRQLRARDAAGSARHQAAADAVAEIERELDDLAERVGAGKLSQAFAERTAPGIEKRLAAARAHEESLSRPPALSALPPGRDVAARWEAAPMSARREVARLLLSPAYLGQLRVMRSPVPGHSCPVDDRVKWVQD